MNVKILKKMFEVFWNVTLGQHFEFLSLFKMDGVGSLHYAAGIGGLLAL